MPDTLVLTPGRFAWITSKLGHAPNWMDLNVRPVQAIPTNLGAGTNEDRVIAFPASEVVLFLGTPSIQVFPEVGSATGTVRVQAVQYASLVAGRRPAALGVASGTEFVSTTAF
jgi:hypothetical protein